jgi:hypothetical protein
MVFIRTRSHPFVLNARSLAASSVLLCNMRAALLAFALSATVSVVLGQTCPAPVAPAATPTPTPYPSLVQPGGLCPSACRGWGSSFNSALNWYEM